MFKSIQQETEEFETQFRSIESDLSINRKSLKTNLDDFQTIVGENDSTIDSDRKRLKSNCHFKTSVGQSKIEESIDSSSIASDPEVDEVKFLLYFSQKYFSYIRVTKMPNRLDIINHFNFLVSQDKMRKDDH